MNSFSKLGFFLVFFGSLALFNSCDSKKHEQVPYVPINIQINVYPNLEAMGIGTMVFIVPDENNYGIVQFPDDERKNFNLFSKVYGHGIILYRSEREVFYAFDRTCTYLPVTNNCGVEFSDAGYLVKCPCCESEFAVTALALPLQNSQAALGLKEYAAVVSNGTLRIVN